MKMTNPKTVTIECQIVRPVAANAMEKPKIGERTERDLLPCRINGPKQSDNNKRQA